MGLAPDIAGFSRLIRALDPWLSQVVIVGGWAHRLYHFHPAAQQLDFAPIVTLDADIALPQMLPLQPTSIRDALVLHGFREEFRGDDMPPATLYHLGDSDTGFYAEFLTPLSGGAHKRSGKRKATAQVSGVNSQQLRFIELLLSDPWMITLSADGFGLSAPTVIRVPNPVGFMAQKLLIHSKRSGDDQAKDILYIHDTLQVFGASLDDLRAAWSHLVRPILPLTAVKRIESATDRLFGESTDAVRRAAKFAADRKLSPESLRESCRYGLQQIINPPGM